MHLFSRCRLVRFRDAVGMKENQGEAPGWLVGSCWLWNFRSFLTISDNLKLKRPGFQHGSFMFMTLWMAGWLDNSWILWLLGGSVEWKQLEGECTPCISTMLWIFDAHLLSCWKCDVSAVRCIWEFQSLFCCHSTWLSPREPGLRLIWRHVNYRVLWIGATPFKLPMKWESLSSYLT